MALTRRSPIAAALILLFTASHALALDAPRMKPPAPGPSFIARPDLERLRAVKEAIARRQFAQARSAAGSIADPTARSLADWYYFDAEDPLVDIGAADAFLDRHPEWPSAGKIQSHAEKRLLWTTAPGVILSFFESRDPLTGEGKLQLARAQFATGRADAAALHVKDAWRNNNFTLSDEQRLLANYGAFLDPEDHVARVDRLLWAREATTAKRAFSRLPAAEKRRADARAALLLGASDAQRQYNHLSDEDRADPGVMLAAVRYFRRQEEEARAVAIAKTAPADASALRNPSRWWGEQQLLMRWAMKNRQYSDAYALSSRHGLDPDDEDFSEAEFDAGWIALRFLNDPARAEQHFAALAATVSAPISVARGWYWLGRAAEAKGETNIAQSRYARAAEQIYTFYGQLAAEKLGGEALMRAFEESAPATPEEKARFGSRPAVAALRMLTDLKDDRAFLVFAFHIDDALQSRGEFRELADLAMRMNAPHVAVRAGKVAVRAGAFAPDIAYPDVSVPTAATRYAPAEIILGLSRQESEFNPRAYSSAGARGMMQLIPSTALATARKERISYRQSALLDDPAYNMTLGSAHLSHLIDRYQGSWIMTFAAYNAGVNRVSQWVEDYGDPRSAAVDPLDWIEQIPFEETRNYVQRVLENSQIYRSRLNSTAIAGALSGDIERGGAARRIATIAPAGTAGSLPEMQARIAALAEPILNPLSTAPEALSHIRLKPPPASAVGSDAPAKKTPARARGLQNFFQRRPPPPPPGKHEDSEAIAPAPVAADASDAPVAMEAIGEPPIFAPAEGGSETPSALKAADAPATAPVGGATLSPPGAADTALIPIEPAAETAAHPQAAAATPPDPIRFEMTAQPQDGSTRNDKCLSYGDFIAETAKEEASADDLNAGALAEFRGGGKPCE